MQYFGQNRMRGLVLPAALLALALGACGSMERATELMPKGTDFSVTNFEWNPYSKASMSVPSTFQRAPITAADYVSADGSCAAAAAAEDSSEPKVAGAVALQMSECAVVRVLGAPEKVDIGANERGERLTKLLYSRGERPGLYSFTAGRLTEVARVAEAPPQKPQKPAAKPRRAAT
jgi:hypothetical protein